MEVTYQGTTVIHMALFIYLLSRNQMSKCISSYKELLIYSGLTRFPDVASHTVSKERIPWQYVDNMYHFRSLWRLRVTYIEFGACTRTLPYLWEGKKESLRSRVSRRSQHRGFSNSARVTHWQGAKSHDACASFLCIRSESLLILSLHIIGGSLVFIVE